MNSSNQGQWFSEEHQRPHRRLDVWRHAKTVSVRIYAMTRRFPDEEKYGLVSQMRRAAISIASNIAEGAGRNTSAQFLRFLYIARGSLNELDTQLEIAGELGYLRAEDVESLRKPFSRLSSTLDGVIRSQKNR